jgi:hypothetical protein
MGINASDWCDNFYIWWADDQTPRGFVDADYRMKVMDGGMLLFQEKAAGGFRVVAPHTWTHIKTSDVDPTR